MEVFKHLLLGCDNEIEAWVRGRIPHVSDRGFGPFTAIGVLNKSDTKIIAGMVLHDYQPEFRNIQLTMAADSPMWAKKENIKHLLFYPFRQLNVFKIWTCTPIDNTMAIKVNEHIGFKREAVLSHHFGKKRHAVICRLLQPEFEKLYEVRNG